MKNSLKSKFESKEVLATEKLTKLKGGTSAINYANSNISTEIEDAAEVTMKNGR